MANMRLLPLPGEQDTAAYEATAPQNVERLLDMRTL